MPAKHPSAVRLGDPGPDLWQCGAPRPKGSGPSFYSCPSCRQNAREHRRQALGFFVALLIALALYLAGFEGCLG